MYFSIFINAIYRVNVNSKGIAQFFGYTGSSKGQKKKQNQGIAQFDVSSGKNNYFLN